MFLGLSDEQNESLKFEVISDRARLKLTRLLRHKVKGEEGTYDIISKNRAINIARNVLGLPLYVLEAEDGEYYYPGEHAWHNAELELIMRRPSTIELVEILADLIEDTAFSVKEINDIFEEDGASISFDYSDYQKREIEVNILPIEQIDEVKDSEEHPNIRKLIKRMEAALSHKDYPEVLHASASVFETLAKDVVNLSSVENRSLGSFFDRYRKDSSLPTPILDYILEIFNKRNTEPLAGHGSRQPPKIAKKQAIIISEMTKSFVRIERQLAMTSLDKEKIK